MKSFLPIDFNWELFEKELDEFGDLLRENNTLEEQKQILPFFKSRLYLSAGISLIDIFNPDSLAYEFDLWGKFTCDLVIGSSHNKTYYFIEFEDAKQDSLFKVTKNKSSSEFGNRFEHGYSQIVDWFHVLNNMEDNAEFESRFGSRKINFQGILIIGRSAFLRKGNHDEYNRLLWRMNNVVVNSKRIFCYTFDELYEKLKEKIDILKTMKAYKI